MSDRVFLSIFFIACLSAGLGPPARAEERISTLQSPHSADKSKYTLFNPTPSDELRGMDTDRPNVTNTSHTIDAGHFQIETGAIDYSYNRSHSSNSDTRSDNFAFGQFNFRLGVLNNVEVNAAIETYDLDRTSDYMAGNTSRAGGFGDAVVGAKFNLWGDDGGDDVWATALAIQPQFKFPTARSTIGNGRFEFSVAVPFLMNLPRGFHLSFQPGVSLERNSLNSGYVTGFENAISIDRVVWRSLDVYLEYASDVTTESHVKVAQTVDVGCVFPVTDNIVVDIGANVGLNDASNDVEFLAGVSFRF